ncbi:MAG TPA: ankyrin repeat domain-containing protein, partial [Gemmatimonadaceae bacterium]|nr:ankyrin repeat domain-containing protein [Gemmatimonadaceae bacterium]
MQPPPNSAERRRPLGVLGAIAAAVLLTAAAPPANSPVADAAMRRDTAAVRQLLKQGADVNAAQNDGMTALHWVAQHGDAAAAKMLIYAGARLEAATRNGNYTPLHLATRAGRGPVVKVLLDAGANANATTTSGGATPLHFAAAQGSVEAITALLAHGAAVDVREGAWEQTPLMWAAAYNRLDAIRLLIGKGASLSAVSKVEDVPARERADRAVAQLRNRRMQALRAAEQPAGRAGGAPAAPGGGREGGRGALAQGAAGEAGRGGNAAPREGQPAAQDSSRREAPDSTRLAQDSSRREAPDSTRPAVSASYPSEGAQVAEGGGRGARGGQEGAAPAAQGGRGGRAGGGGERSLGYSDLVGNKGGLTPLLFAVRQGNMECVKALVEAGADIGQVSGGDHTSPLLMATINGHFDIAKYLLERGASPNQASDAGATPLYAALNVQWSAKSLYPQPTAHTQQKTTYLELMQRLLQLGADPNARLTKHLWYMSYNFDLLGVNTTGATPFWRAAYGTDVPAMRLLVSYGADHTIPTRKPAGRQRGDDAPAEDEGGAATDPSGLPPIPNGGPGVYPIHAASGVGYGEGYAANSHRHAPDGWMPAVKYLVEELGADVNARDHNGYNPLHH